MIPHAPGLQSEIDALCTLAQWCSSRGWLPATAGNFSVRDTSSGVIHISPSGLDKGLMTPEHLLALTGEGYPVDPHRRPSAETGLHVVVYRDRPEARAIAHVHTIWNTLLSSRFLPEGRVVLEDYELLKALSGVETHEHREEVPVLNNTQNYPALCEELAATLAQNPRAHGVLLSAHGLYTWGRSVAETRRHLEALEFLFEVEARKMTSADF